MLHVQALTLSHFWWQVSWGVASGLSYAPTPWWNFLYIPGVEIWYLYIMILYMHMPVHCVLGYTLDRQPWLRSWPEFLSVLPGHGSFLQRRRYFCMLVLRLQSLPVQVMTALIVCTPTPHVTEQAPTSRLVTAYLANNTEMGRQAGRADRILIIMASRT